MRDQTDITCQQADELITGFVDGELDNRERRTIQAHLSGCLQCQEHFDREQQLKFLLLRSSLTVTTPSVLFTDIANTLARWPARPASGGLMRSITRLLPRVTAAGAFALLLVTAVHVFNNPAPADLVPRLLNHYRVAMGAGSAFISTQDLFELQSRLAHAVGGEFKPMAYDFNAMGMRLIGGAKLSLGGTPVLLMVYQGNGVRLHCYTFKGDAGGIAIASAQFFDVAKNVNFYQYVKGDVNGVLHREGDVLCLLSSSMPMARLLRWARIKARRNHS